MENTENNGFAPNKEKNESDNTEQLPGHAETVSGSFDKEDQSSDSSIGTGSSDQGIEPGDEEEEDAFRKALSGSSPGAGFTDGINVDGETPRNGGGLNEWPSKGLVEEGPGPDS